jgi:chitinase
LKKLPGDIPFQKWWMGAVCLLMALSLKFMPVTATMPVSTAEADTKEEVTTMAVSAYVYDRLGLAFRDEDASFITQMNYSFALIKDGKVSGSHWHSIDAFTEYIKRHPGILPFMAVGGWGADGFSQASSTESGRAEFVESAVSLMQEHGFLGIDIDWEYPGSSVAGIKSSKNDPDNLLLLLKELRAALDGLTTQDGVKRYISIAVGGSKQYAEKLDCEAIGQLIDQVNVMTYDLRGFEKVTGHHTGLYPQEGDEASVSASTAMEAFRQAGFPNEKLMMGAAFYGRAWRSVKSTKNNGLGQKAGTSGNKSYGYDVLQTMISDGSYTRYWDEQAKAPYLFNGKTFISYEDEESITAKGTYAKDNGLMGIMFWEYGQDTTGTLVKALYTAMNGA